MLLHALRSACQWGFQSLNVHRGFTSAGETSPWLPARRRPVTNFAAVPAFLDCERSILF